MTNNDILRRLRYALDLSDYAVMDLFRSIGRDLTRADLERLYAREDEGDFEECPDETLRDFLDGLVLKLRGPSPRQSGAENVKVSADRGVSGADFRPKRDALTNNDIIKALRIALKLTTDEIVGIMAAAGTKVSSSELGALFRKRTHPKYRDCGDQFLRNFITGLSVKKRGGETES